VYLLARPFFELERVCRRAEVKGAVEPLQGSAGVVRGTVACEELELADDSLYVVDGKRESLVGHEEDEVRHWVQRMDRTCRGPRESRVRLLDDRGEVDLVRAVVAVPKDLQHFPAAFSEWAEIADSQRAVKHQARPEIMAVDDEAVDEIPVGYVRHLEDLTPVARSAM
jgi:hypothetical protein